jgi:NAD(P)-dependent dehydrogenase (short-subunit alcohol dehydrogenase family)
MKDNSTSPNLHVGLPEGVSSGLDSSFDTFSLSSRPLLAGKRALVTGAGIGIGRGVAFELAREGAEVGIHYFNELEGAEGTKRIIEQRGGKAHLFQADLSTNDGHAQLVNQAAERLGAIDILVNNTGITSNVPFLETPPDFYDRLMRVNLRSLYFVTQSVAKIMKKAGGGTIVNLASLHASFAINEFSVYAMTKAAIVAFTRNVALELAPCNIRMNAVAPGWCFGETHLKALGAESRAEDAAKTPAGHVSNPTTIGRLIVQLCGSDLRYFLGQTLVCDGGLSAVMPTTGPFNEPQTMKWGAHYMQEQEG